MTELEQKVKKKKDNWFNKIFKKEKFKKPGKVAVLFLRNHGIAEPMELEPKEGFFNINRKSYHERRDCIYTVGKDRIPLAIIPEWSMIPLGTRDWAEKTMQEKFNELQDHCLKGIRHAELVKMGDRPEFKLTTKKIIVYGILAIIALAIVFGYT